MNLFLWILQSALALLCFAGGGYKVSGSARLAAQFRALPPAGWRALAVIEMLGAVLLIVPAVADWMPLLTPLAACVLALENLGLAGLYSRYSRKLAVANPLVWALVMALVAAFVAYGRYSHSPAA